MIQWKVVEDRTRHGKRWVEIEDTVNKRKYSGYFNLSANDAYVLARFKDQVKEHRKEIESKKSTIDLTNFEQQL